MMKENVEELNNNAIHLAQKGNFDEAVACFKRALTLDKENYLLWFNLALTYRDAGYIDKAKKAKSLANARGFLNAAQTVCSELYAFRACATHLC